MRRNPTLLVSFVLLSACSNPVQRPVLPAKSDSQSASKPDGNSIEKNNGIGSSNTIPDTKPMTEGKPGGQTQTPVENTTDKPDPKPVVQAPPAPAPKPMEPAVPAVSAALSPELMKFSSGRTKSDKTPMGSWFNDVVNYVPNADEKSLLSDPNKDVPIDGHPDWKYKHFDVKLYPTGDKPDPADGGQRAIGDCNMLAFLNSFAYQYPDFLKSIIADKGNGVFEVSMFDPKAQRIKIMIGSNFMVDGGGGITQVAGKNNTVNWITVMEKAIMKYNYVYKVWHGDGPAKVEGFGSEAGAPMLTGQGDSYAFDRGALPKPEDLTRVVKEALKAGKLITGGFGVPMDLNGIKSVTGHAYTVLVPADGKTMISMRNPWGFSPKADGGADNSKVGILDIPPIQDWFKTIDLRIMEPGIAGTQGQTQPYMVKSNFNFTANGKEDYELQIFLKYHPGI